MTTGLNEMKRGSILMNFMQLWQRTAGRWISILVPAFAQVIYRIGIALPEDLGGAGLGISEATMMLQTISQSGAGMGGAQSIHANVYATQPVAKFATPEQRRQMLPDLIKGEWRACFGVTEPSTGLDTLRLKTQAVRDGDSYRVSGQKIWISSAQVATKMVLLARTTPLEQVQKPSEGLSLFFIDFDKNAPGLDVRRIKKMGGRAVDANEVFFDNYRIPVETRIGDEGKGFKMVCSCAFDAHLLLI